MLKVQIAGKIRESCQNGDGFRNVIFFSGCDKRCPGCQNKEMQDINYGDSVDVEDVIEYLLGGDIDLIDGITISGGEPFLQPEALSHIVTKIKTNTDMTVWVYTGRTLVELETQAKTNKYIKQVLEQIDVLVDGEYIKEIPSTERYKGSNNQIIHRFSKRR